MNEIGCRRWVMPIVFLMLLGFHVLVVTIEFYYGKFNLSGFILPPLLVWGVNLVATIHPYYIIGAYILIVLVMILNKGNLHELHVDTIYFIIFIVSGIISTLISSLPMGWALGIVTIFIAYLLISRKFTFTQPKAMVWQLVLLVFVLFIGSTLLIWNKLNVSRILETMGLFLDTVPGAVYEEFIFRGLLWYLLRKFQWSDAEIFIFQAVLFWLLHINMLYVDPVDFWIIVPISSLIFGFMVWRTKSIAPSTIAHILTNLFFGMLSVSSIA